MDRIVLKKPTINPATCTKSQSILFSPRRHEEHEAKDYFSVVLRIKIDPDLFNPLPNCNITNFTKPQHKTSCVSCTSM
jgi:hypothetical protein